jgi:hypothetical protein
MLSKSPKDRPPLRPIAIGGAGIMLALAVIALFSEGPGLAAEILLAGLAVIALFSEGPGLAAEILLAGLGGLAAMLWWERRERKREDESAAPSDQKRKTDR